MNVLVVEDDELLAAGLTTLLERSEYNVTHAPTGGYASAALRSGEYDLVILDLGLPDIDGVDVLRDLRARGQRTPVLVLTARDGVEQQVAALDFGADDYMEKPFDLRELEARIRALLRRSHVRSGEEIRLGALVLNPFERVVAVDGVPSSLPAREYQILEALVLNADKVMSKARLAQRLMQDNDDIGDNAVEVYVHRLRRRLAQSGTRIRTVRGVGYILEAG